MAVHMEVVIGFEFLSGREIEIVVKELSVVGVNATKAYRLKSTYTMMPHALEENGIN